MTSVVGIEPPQRHYVDASSLLVKHILDGPCTYQFLLQHPRRHYRYL